jgi:hypothetical protein
VGKFSFFIALFAIVLLAIYFAVHYLFSGSPVQGVLAPLLQLSQASLLVGLLLGIAGLFQSGQSKRLAVLGVLMNGGIVCAQVLLFVVVFYPELFAFTKTYHPLPWIKVVAKPWVSGFLGETRQVGDVTFYVETSAGEWKRISFPETTFNPRLAVLSPDTALIQGIGRPRSEPRVMGEVFRKGIDEPVISIPEGSVILPLSSGGFITTRLDPDAQHPPTGITVHHFGSNGERLGEWSIAIPDWLAGCGWGARLKLVGDDPVYGAGGCHDRSGLYRVSPNGFLFLAPFSGDPRVDHKKESSLTQTPVWYRDSW